jgi:hypothetical protein
VEPRISSGSIPSPTIPNSFWLLPNPSIVPPVSHARSGSSTSLLEILETRGFGSKWIGWIRSVVIGGSVSILENGEESNTFKTGKGLR